MFEPQRRIHHSTLAYRWMGVRPNRRTSWISFSEFVQFGRRENAISSFKLQKYSQLIRMLGKILKSVSLHSSCDFVVIFEITISLLQPSKLLLILQSCWHLLRNTSHTTSSTCISHHISSSRTREATSHQPRLTCLTQMSAIRAALTCWPFEL